MTTFYDEDNILYIKVLTRNKINHFPYLSPFHTDSNRIFLSSVTIVGIVTKLETDTVPKMAEKFRVLWTG